MADQFVDKDLKLSEIIAFIRAQEATAREQAQEHHDDWDYYHQWHDTAMTLDQLASDLIARFNEAEQREATFKINGGRATLSDLMAAEKSPQLFGG